MAWIVQSNLKKLEYCVVSLASFYRVIRNGHFCCSTTVRMYGTTYVSSRQQDISLGFWNKPTVCNVSCCTFSSTVSGVCFTDRQACLSWLVIGNQLKAPSSDRYFFLSFKSIILVICDSEMQQQGMRELHQLFISCRPFHSSQKSICLTPPDLWLRSFVNLTGKWLGNPFVLLLKGYHLSFCGDSCWAACALFYLFSLIKNNFRSLLVLDLGRNS